MLNNLTNFFNLIKGRFIKSTLEADDLVAIGTKDGKFNGGYKPTAIKFEDLSNQIRPYECYTVSLYQTGIDEPEVQVEFENTLGVTATYQYISTGEYVIIFDKPIFQSIYDYVTISQLPFDDNIAFSYGVYASPAFYNAVIITSFFGGTYGDSVIGQGFNPCILEVRVYN